MINSYNDHKRYLILNIINHLGSVSRTDLSELTGFQLATISTVTKQLIAENILVETGSYSAGPGRKRTLLQLNTQYLCAISVSFSESEITCITAQLDGTVIAKMIANFTDDISRTSLSDHVQRLIRTSLETNADRCIIGVGICTPSNDPASHPIVDIDPAFRQLRDWIENILIPQLRQSFAVPIEMFYDIALAALVEQSYGSARGVRDLLCVELSNGIGCSIYCNGKPVVGACAEAGELGHTVVDLSGSDSRLCYCGKHGCVEHAASLPVLLKRISGALEGRVFSLLQSKASDSLTADDVRIAADAGDLLCRHYIRQAADLLGIAIANAAMLLNPQMIVLYGHMLCLGDYFLSRLKAAVLENLSPSSGITEGSIVVSAHLQEQLALGAISELFATYLKKEDFGWVYRLPQMEL